MDEKNPLILKEGGGGLTRQTGPRWRHSAVVGVGGLIANTPSAKVALQGQQVPEEHTHRHACVCVASVRGGEPPPPQKKKNGTPKERVTPLRVMSHAPPNLYWRGDAMTLA